VEPWRALTAVLSLRYPEHTYLYSAHTLHSSKVLQRKDEKIEFKLWKDMVLVEECQVKVKPLEWPPQSLPPSEAMLRGATIVNRSKGGHVVATIREAAAVRDAGLFESDFALRVWSSPDLR
jgi:hypothetical protein